jgi:hypothetical protein
MSVGSAANTLAAATTGALENLMVTAEQDFTATSFTMAAGEAAGTYDTFTVATSGAADIALATLTTAANINQIAFSSEGEGDRAFTIGAIAGLKTDIGDDEAGVDITGAGTGTVVVTATGAFLNTLRIDGSAFDGSVEAIASAANAIDADNFTGVDVLNFGADMGGVAISNLDADVVAKVGFAQTGTQVITGSTTSRDVLFSLNAGTAGAVTIANELTIDDAKTINFSTENTHATGTAQTYTLTTLTNAGAANEINIDAAEDADFVLTNAYTTFAASAGNRVFTLNMMGTGDATLTGGITSGNNMDEIVLTANGDGTYDFGTITATAQADLGVVTFSGASDIVVDDIVDDMTTGPGAATSQKTVAFNGDGDAAIADMNVTIEAGGTYTINSESADGTGENDIADASNIAFDTAAGTLEITGNQKLIVGSGTGLSMETADNVENTLDASAFTGELELNVVRGDTGTGNDTHTIKIGTGDTTIAFDNSTTNGTEDVFIIEFSEDGVAEVQIENFSMADALDKLDFTAFTDAVGATTYNNATGVVAINGGDDKVTFSVQDYDNDGNDDLVGTSSLFDGEVVILGAADLTLASIAVGNFA